MTHETGVWTTWVFTAWSGAEAQTCGSGRELWLSDKEVASRLRRIESRSCKAAHTNAWAALLILIPFDQWTQPWPRIALVDVELLRVEAGIALDQDGFADHLFHLLQPL